MRKRSFALILSLVIISALLPVCSFAEDKDIILKTITTVLNKEGINSETSATMEEFMGSENFL